MVLSAEATIFLTKKPAVAAVDIVAVLYFGYALPKKAFPDCSAPDDEASGTVERMKYCAREKSLCLYVSEWPLVGCETVIRQRRQLYLW